MRSAGNFLGLVLVLAMLAGWFMNIVAAFGTHEPVMLALRVFGVVFFPAGALLGWL